MPGSDALEDEFDLVARWTEEVVDDLGSAYAMAAGCRGSGSPASLAWLAEALEVGAARRMLDAGSGLGGPAAWLAEHFGVTPVCAEPMRGAARASRRLFGLPAVVAPGEALPFSDGSFDAAWCLGVLDTAGDRPRLLAELRRVLDTGGRLGLLAFVAADEETRNGHGPPLPVGNEFSTGPELRDLLAGAGFAVLQTVPAASLRDAPVAWQTRADRVEEVLAERHAGDPRFQDAQEQSARIGRLLAEGRLESALVHAVAV